MGPILTSFVVSIASFACEADDGPKVEGTQQRPQPDEYVGLGFFRSELPKSTGFAPAPQRNGTAAAPVLIVGTLGGIVFDTDGAVWSDTRTSIAAPRQDVLVGRIDPATFGRIRALIPGALRAPFLRVPEGCRDCEIDFIQAYSAETQALVELATIGDYVRRRDSEDAKTLLKWILAVQRELDAVQAGRWQRK